MKPTIPLFLLLLLAASLSALAQVQTGPSVILTYDRHPGAWQPLSRNRIQYTAWGAPAELVSRRLTPGYNDSTRYVYTYDANRHLIRRDDIGLNAITTTVLTNTVDAAGRLTQVWMQGIPSASQPGVSFWQYQFFYSSQGLMDSVYTSIGTDSLYDQRTINRYSYNAQGTPTSKRSSFYVYDRSGVWLPYPTRREDSLRYEGWKPLDPHSIVKAYQLPTPEIFTLPLRIMGSGELYNTLVSSYTPYRTQAVRAGNTLCAFTKTPVGSGRWVLQDSTCVDLTPAGALLHVGYKTGYFMRDTVPGYSHREISYTYDSLDRLTEIVDYEPRNVLNQNLCFILRYEGATAIQKTLPFLRVSPNPATDFLEVGGDLGAHPVRIIAADGRITLAVLAQNGRIDLRELSPGLYIFEWGRQKIRFVKSRE